MDLGINISKLRLNRKMNQRELAKELGVSAGAVGLWETGKRYPDLCMLKKIAQFFHVSTDYLLGLTSTPDAKESVHGEHLLEDEKKLLDTYRSLTSDEKQVVLGKALDLKLSSTTPNRKKDIG